MVERFLCIKNSMHELDSLTCLYKNPFCTKIKEIEGHKVEDFRAQNLDISFSKIVILKLVFYIH